MALTPNQLRGRRALKRFMYSQLALRDAAMIAFGRQEPLIRFKVEGEPASTYYNFEIDPTRVDSLAKELDLPYPLAPLRVVAGEDPFYCLALNVYRVSGITNGIRAEWSLFVRDPKGIPRYCVVEARADQGSMDPIDIITKASLVAHSRAGDSFSSEVAGDDGTRFKARFELQHHSVQADREWIEANDYIYWRNGICDRTFYDAGLAFPRLQSVDPASVEIEHTTPWSEIVLPVPKNVIVVENEIEFVIDPWCNLDQL